MKRPKIIATENQSPFKATKWWAFYEGEEEAGNYGFGRTEAEAIQDFIDNCQEAHDERLGITEDE
jgi:hypothetical protein